MGSCVVPIVVLVCNAPQKKKSIRSQLGDPHIWSLVDGPLVGVFLEAQMRITYWQYTWASYYQ